ncbi:hypothetical protein BGX33_011349 [Mortierella sp. NVP41]|nr:hypothetical protein BGX33_011349 [Mortierella sp. NVP41]
MTIRHVTERLHDAWSSCFFGSTGVAETTSMTLFPAHSDFEHLMVIVDRRGNGEIWDWINNKLVASLTIAEDERMQKNPSLRQNLYFWGVQVNWTIEEPARTMSSGLAKIEEVQERSFFRKHGDFRIVALADGQDSEWETIRWNIKETDLREQQSGRLGEAGWEVKSMNRHYEACTMGQTHVVPCGNLIGTDAMVVDNEPQPLLFIAFLIWDHYRIALTSKFGLCLFDMNGEMPVDILTTDPAFRSRLPMWVTDLEDATQNPLLDIATAGDYLILTRRYSHILWPFRKVVT